MIVILKKYALLVSVLLLFTSCSTQTVKDKIDPFRDEISVTCNAANSIIIDYSSSDIRKIKQVILEDSKH